MDWLEMLQQIFNILIVPVLTAVSLFLVRFIQSKTNELKAKTNDETLQKYMDMLNKTITDCVLATNQTYVESLKGQNAFDKNAQLEAFKKTYDAVMGILTEDAKEYHIEVHSDNATVHSESGKITVHGNANKVNTVSGSVSVAGSVSGNVSTISGSVRSNGITGDVSTISGSIYK